MGKLNIFICDSYIDNYREALDELKISDIELHGYTNICQKNNSNTVLNSLNNSSDMLVIAPSTCPAVSKIKDSHKHMYNTDYCVEHLVDRHTYNELLTVKSYIITKGWLCNWEENIKTLGFDENTIKKFFSEWCEKIVLLCSDYDSGIKSALNQLSSHIDRPVEILQVSLSNTKNIIERNYYKWKFETSQKENYIEKNELKQKVVESKTVRKLINEIISTVSRVELEQKLSAFWKMLFGAGKVEYQFFQDEEPLSSQPYIYNEDKNQLVCHLVANKICLGQCTVEGFLFPDKIDKYHDLIIVMINISSISFSTVLEREKLLFLNNRLKLSFDSVNDGLISIDAKDRISLINPRARIFINRFSVAPIDFSGISHIEDIKSGEWDKIQNLYKRVKAELKPLNLEKPICAIQDGEEFSVKCRIAPIETNKKSFRGALITLKDISLDERLFKSRLKVQRLEGISSVASGIAHEFNNALYSIMGYVELALDGTSEGTPPYSDLSKALDSIDKTKRLSNKLLTLSEGGEPRKAYTDIITVIETVLSKLTIGDTITIVKYFEAPLPELLIDSTQMSVVLTNVLQNAIESFNENK
ncbi:MAG: hypothetical protein JEY99_17815 [Spirochaetales bacterium]|nr:hypothetical protein [Spirochaetales bacterium]